MNKCCFFSLYFLFFSSTVFVLTGFSISSFYIVYFCKDWEYFWIKFIKENFQPLLCFFMDFRNIFILVSPMKCFILLNTSCLSKELLCWTCGQVKDTIKWMAQWNHMVPVCSRNNIWWYRTASISLAIKWHTTAGANWIANVWNFYWLWQVVWLELQVIVTGSRLLVRPSSAHCCFRVSCHTALLMSLWCMCSTVVEEELFISTWHWC
jgi:hypothetical protein